MALSKRLTTHMAAALGCLLLFAVAFWCARLLLLRSWSDLDDANVRLHILKIHGIDWDFVWSVVAFGSVLLTIAAMFLCCLWMLWLLVKSWNVPRGRT